MSIFWLTEIIANMLLCLIKRIRFVLDGVFPLLLEELFKHIECLNPLSLFKLVFLVLDMFFEEKVSPSLFVEVAIIFSVRATCHLGTSLRGKNFRIYLTSWSLCVIKKLILVIILESVISCGKYWVFNSFFSIVSSLLFEKTGISQLLVESILVDNTLVEFRLSISSLEPLLLFTSNRIFFMIFHLVQLFELIIILVDFSLELSK